MNSILFGLLISLGGAIGITILGISIKKCISWRSDDVNPAAVNNKWNFKMNLFNK